MQKRHFVFLSFLASLTIVSVVGYGACAMEIGDRTHDLIASDPPVMIDGGATLPIPPPELEDPEFDPAGIGEGNLPGGDLGGPPRAPDDPDPGTADNTAVLPPEELGQGLAPDHVRAACGSATCAATEVCCVHDGTCYPRTCRDCCAGADDAPRPDEGALEPPIIDPAAR